MSKREPDLAFLQGNDAALEDVGALAKRVLMENQLWHMWLFVMLTGFGMVGAGLVDVALMYSVMSAGFTDALGRAAENTTHLWFGSAIMLIGYWGLGVLYQKNFVLRRCAYFGYAAMVVVIAVLLFPVQVPRYNEIWASLSAFDPFSGQAAAAEAPKAVLLFLVLLNAVLFSGPGLFFIWLKGRFVFWVERFRVRGEAKRLLALADEVDALTEVMAASGAVVDDLGDPDRQAQIIRAALSQGMSAYGAVVDRKAEACKTARLDVETPKALKQQAEADYAAAMACKASLQSVSL